MKRCSKCGEMKELSQFHKAKSHSDGRVVYCKDCKKQIAKEYNKNNRHRRKAINLRNQYGITIEDYTQMMSSQNKKCLVCGEERRLVVDHDHATGKVRGLLCTRCNNGLGMFQDKLNIMQNAIKYLQGFTHAHPV